MSTAIKTLILEDTVSDAKLVIYELRQAGFDPIWARVETEADFLAQLKPDFDVILSDYSMPQFNALRALDLLDKSGFDIPFIIITGTISEEVAAESIKRGAADYLLKDRLGRLGQAVTRVMEEKLAREQKRRTEAALRESEERYRLLISHIPDVTWMADRDGQTIFVSPNAERLYGLTAEEMCRPDNCAWFSRIHPGDLASVQKEYAALFSEGRSFDVEYRTCKKNNEWIWVRSRAISTYEQNGMPLAYGVTSDITERKRLETQLSQAQKMEAIGRLAGGVAHDFNNMLTIIIGFADVMLAQLPQDGQFSRHAEQIKEAGERAASLTRQLLAFSRQQVLQPQVLDLNDVVCRTEKMLRRLIGEDVDLVTLPGLRLGRVKADPGQVEQVIMNLVVNARDAMPNGGRVVIETENVTVEEAPAHPHSEVPPGSYVTLTVSDNGSGIDAQTLSHIFEPFFTTKELGKGTGLGLSTVYGIVKQSGGFCAVDSEPAMGTRFKVYLPLVEETVAPIRPRLERPELPQSSETILLVEDDDMVRAFAQHVLQANGYEVLPAAKGADALLLSMQHPGQIHLMLTDTVMPEMSGPELAQRLKPMRPGMKVLFVSGYTADTIIHHGVLGQDIEFLQKPFSPHVLASKIRDMLDEKVVSI